MQKLFLFLLGLVAIWYARRLWRRQDADGQSSSRVEDGGRDVSPETMRECFHCGVLVPESEGLISGGEFFCSPEHARAAGRTS